MTARPAPTSEAVTRIHALGEKAIVQFADEVSYEALREIVPSLPPVPGFRKTSNAGIDRQKVALGKKIAAKPTVKSPATDCDYRALYVIWRSWASEHLGEPQAIDNLLDDIEKAEEEIDSRPGKEAAATNSAITTLFATLRDWSLENKCTRERIERLLAFSPFSETKEILSLIEGSKSSVEVNRDLTLTRLPQRLRHDEEEIQSLKAQLNTISTSIKSSATEMGNLRKVVTELRLAVKSLVEKEAELRSSIDARDVEAFRKEANERVKHLERNLNEISRKLDALASETPKSALIDGIVDRLAAVEHGVNSGAQANNHLSAKISDDINGLAQQVNSLIEQASRHAQLDALSDRLAALEKTNEVSPALIRRKEDFTYAETSHGSALPRIQKLTPSGGSEARAFGSAGDIIDALAANLEALGSKKSAAQGIAQEIVAASLSGQIVFLKGALATEVARSCAQTLSASSSYRLAMPIGLNDGELIRAALIEAIGRRADEISIVVIEGLNRSALDVFAHVLRDLADGEWQAQGQEGRPVLFFASILESAASLPIEQNYLESGPIFDLDYLDWRSRRPGKGPIVRGALSLSAFRSIRQQLDAKTVDAEEALRLVRKFSHKRNPLVEYLIVAAYGALKLLHEKRGGPSPLQSLAFGWLVPLWITTGVSKEEADSELDGGKCEADKPDPRIASILAIGEFISRQSSERR